MPETGSYFIFANEKNLFRIIFRINNLILLAVFNHENLLIREPN